MSATSREQQQAIDELRGVVRGFVDRASRAEARRVLDGGSYDPAVWATMADQLGLQGLTIPEEYGGAGAGWREAVVVLEEMGRTLLPSAYLATTVLASTTVAAAKDDDLAAELLPRLASGEATAALAVLEQDGHWDLTATRVSARKNAGGYRLDGTKIFVVDGHLADVLLVSARSELGVCLFVVAADSAGLTRTALPVLDPTRPLARLEFDGAAARLLGAEGHADAVLAHTFDRAILAVAAEALGGADYCMEMSLEYAQNRVAFGRPIGGFQAIKHKLADLYLEIEFARSAVHRAAEAADVDQTKLPELASLALPHCVETFALAATETIHLHGGIGFTWEHDAHLCFRRAKSSQLLFGDATFHRERIAAQLLGDRAADPL
jgi:alkylation response protein AidB-like acyl-CoA dehydrogenase